MTEEQKKYYNAMKKLGSKKPQKPIPRPMVPTHSTSTLKTDSVLHDTSRNGFIGIVSIQTDFEHSVLINSLLSMLKLTL